MRAGLPHSEISGSKSAGDSPELFAACHVLLRLSTPRHPPNALLMLDLYAYGKRSMRRSRRAAPPDRSAGSVARPARDALHEDQKHRNASSPRRPAQGRPHALPHPIKHRVHASPPCQKPDAREQMSDVRHRAPHRKPFPSSSPAGPQAAPPTQPGLASRAGGAERVRTDDLLLAKQALSQLSYSPRIKYLSGFYSAIIAPDFRRSLLEALRG